MVGCAGRYRVRKGQNESQPAVDHRDLLCRDPRRASDSVAREESALLDKALVLITDSMSSGDFGMEKRRGGPVPTGDVRRPERSPAETPEDGRSLGVARRQGEAEAEVLDLTLRLKESLTREHRLLESLEEMREALEYSGQTERELRIQLERYAMYHRAVERSFAWRTVQFLRRLVGRAW
jgi:hypothetical protein